MRDASKGKRNHATMVKIGAETHCVKEWCAIRGIPYGRVMSRIRRGMKPIDALELPYVPYSERKYHEKHLVVNTLARSLGLKPHTVSERLRRGESYETAFRPVEKEYRRGIYNRKRFVEVLVNGVKRRVTYTEALRRLGMSPSARCGRIAMGWDVDDAITIPKTPESEKPARARVSQRKRELAEIGVIV